MSDPDQRPAEQTLRQWAQQRRAQAPPAELHPATRRVLQGEVVRTYGVPAAAPAKPAAGVPWLATWWGRLAWGAPALAALAAVVYVLHREREMHLAMTSDPMPPALRDPTAPQPAGATAPVAPTAPRPLLEERTVTESRAATGDGASLASTTAPMELRHGAGKLERKEAAPPIAARSPAGSAPSTAGGPPPAAPPALAGRFTPADPRADSADVSARADRAQAIKAAPAQTPGNVLPTPMSTAPALAEMQIADPEPEPLQPRAASAAAAAPSGGQFSATPTGSALVKSGMADPAPPGTVMKRQQFVQSEERRALRRNFNSPAPPPVLHSFEFANAGALVQLTDADGSVYTGRILEPDAAGALASAPEQSAAREAAVVRSNPQPPGYAGAGASALPPPSPGAQTLFFRVQGTNRTLQQVVEFEGNLVLPLAPGRHDQTSAAQQAPPLHQGQIQGRLIIGGRTRLDVRANAAP